MTTPAFRTRLFGNPVVAVILGGWFVKTAGSWYLHHAPFGAVLFTFCLALLSLTSWRKLRIHQAWLRQWNDAGGVPAQPASDRRHELFRTKQSKGAVMLPLLLVFVLPLAAQGIPHDAPVMPLLTLTWFGCIGWCVVTVLRRFWKRSASASADKGPECGNAFGGRVGQRSCE